MPSKHLSLVLCIAFIIAIPTYFLQSVYGINKGQDSAETIKGLTSKNMEGIDHAVDELLLDRSVRVKTLINMLDPERVTDVTDSTRCAAAFVLGELRATEAVPALSRALTVGLDKAINLDTSRYDAPIFTALVKIGRPAIPQMLDNLKSGSRDQRKRSLDVINHVLGGKRRMLETLEKFRSSLSDKDEAQSIQESMLWAAKHYKESKEPLY